MSIRINYRTYPTDYINELHRTRGVKGRKKARAFMEYFHDMEEGNHNAERFYAKSWDCSPSTVHAWMKEFDMEIERHYNYLQLKSKQHYNSVSKQTEQIEQTQPSKTSSNKDLNLGSCKDTAEQIEQEQTSEVFNIYNNDDKPESFYDSKEFTNLFFIYSQNTKFVGRKEEAYESFRKTDVDVDLLCIAAMKYLHDPAVGYKKYNLKNFLKNDSYLPYLPNMIRVKVDGKVYEGEYIKEHKIIVDQDNKPIANLTNERLVELYVAGNLEYLSLVKVVS